MRAVQRPVSGVFKRRRPETQGAKRPAAQAYQNRGPKLLQPENRNGNRQGSGSGKKTKEKDGKDHKSQNKLVREAFDEKYIWSCTTCGACTEACPVATEHLAKMIDLQRHLVLADGNISEAMRTVFAGIAAEGSPWGHSQASGPAWARELSIPTIEGNPQAEYLYYPGCAAAFEETAQKTAAAFGKVLQVAGVDFVTARQLGLVLRGNGPTAGK